MYVPIFYAIYNVTSWFRPVLKGMGNERVPGCWEQELLYFHRILPQGDGRVGVGPQSMEKRPF